MDIQKVKIVDLNADYAVVLTNDGAFKRVVRKGGMSVGGGIFITDQDLYMKTTTSKSFKLAMFNKRLLQVTGIMALLIMILFTQSFAPMSYAVISVDINPSIQLFIDADYSVVKIKSMNDEGKKLLSEYDFIKKKSASSVITELFTLASEMEYLKSDQNEILIAAAIYKPSKNDENTLQLNNDVNMLIDAVLSDVDYSIFGQENIVINAVASNAKNIKAAEKEHLSIGQYEKDNHSDAIKPYVFVEDGKPLKTNENNPTIPEETTDKGLDTNGNGNKNGNDKGKDSDKDTDKDKDTDDNDANSNDNNINNNINNNIKDGKSIDEKSYTKDNNNNKENSNYNTNDGKNRDNKNRYNFGIDNIKNNIKNNKIFGNTNNKRYDNDKDRIDKNLGKDGSRH